MRFSEYSVSLYKRVLLLFILLCSFTAKAQLNDFILNVATTDESCLGNGTMTFTVENATPGATFLFTVYMLPNTDTPVSSSSSDFVGSLSAGTYKVIALQTLGNQSNTQEQEVVIENAIVPLEYDITSTTHICTDEGTIIVTPTSGNATQYEIISGPETRPLQDSNTFEHLPAGTYNIRVFNDCGQGVVTTYTLVLDPASPDVSQPIFDENQSADCNTINITNTISYPEGTVISYPITIQYTIYPPNGDPPITISQSYDSGAPSYFEFSNQFQLYGDQQFTYDVQVTNSCGVSYGNSGMVVDPNPQLNFSLSPNECGEHFLTLTMSNYHPPFTLDFTTSPDGFDPSAFNDAHPGPFTDSAVVYGSEDNVLPEGHYEVSATDGCGRESSVAFDIEDEEKEPSATGKNNGCYAVLGSIRVSVPDREIIAATITGAPDTYTQALPQDVSEFINGNGVLVLHDMPLGDYTITVTDNCGKEYTVTVEVPEFVEQDFSASAFADCTVNSGSVQVSSGNGSLVTLMIVSAPPSFDETLPYDVSFNIDPDTGIMYMDSLPEGDYTFQGTDSCGIERAVQVSIEGYVSSGNPYTFVPNCNSFDILLDDAVGNATNQPTYWLQEMSPDDPNQWVHPDTGVAYPEGTMPTTDNSVELINGQANVNFFYQGNFRIVKAFETVGNGEATKLCFEELGQFSYFDSPVINNVYNLACNDNPDDVYIEAQGLDPLIYRIIQKDGEPFVVENGNSNVFSNLEPAVYVFEVEDACGHITPRQVNINLLPNLVSATTPQDMHICIQPGDSYQQQFNLGDQTAAILGGQSPTAYTVTYHLTQQDADTGDNPLPELYTNVTNPQTIYARVVQNYIPVCNATVSFGLQVSEYPEIQMDDQTYICLEEDGGETTLSANGGFDSYLWSTGETTRSITVHEPGVYTVTVANVYGGVSCESTAQITVIPSGQPTDVEVTTTDWTTDSNSITVSASGAGEYEYSIDGINYQESNVFDGLPTGIYTLYIRDAHGCGVFEQEVWLLNYPKFFTPNNDGINDTWHIPYSWEEPDMKIDIFDRYGKLIARFGTDSPGWDGRYNGHRLPATDYWFVVTREDGKVHKGHFSLIR